MAAATVARASRRVLVPIAAGSEEIEAVSIIDTLRRAKYDVVVASVGAKAGESIEMSRGVRIVADCGISTLSPTSVFDAIALPGGMPGAAALGKSEHVLQLLRAQREAGRWVCAICAAPAVVLHANGLVPAGVPLTCHPGFMEKLPAELRTEQRVVVDAKSKTITSRGPGTAIEMALAMIREMDGAEAAEAVAGPMLPARS